MTITTLLPEEFANRLEEVGKKFIELHQYEGVNYDIDFEYGCLVQTECGTVACHGAWLNHILASPDTSVYPIDAPDYKRGANALAERLGFLPSAGRGSGEWAQSYLRFAAWAGVNPKLWGNGKGIRMFSSWGWAAFDSSATECSLEVIGRHYLAVAERVRHYNTTKDP